MRYAALVALSLLGLAPAASAATVEQAAQGFRDGVLLCAAAAEAGLPVSGLPSEQQALVTPANDQARAMLQVPAGRPVYDVVSGAGTALIAEPTDGQCEVMAYGPPVRPVFATLAQALTDPAAGFRQVENRETAADIIRRFTKTKPDGTTVMVSLTGGEPGMAGRRFRFPMLTARVLVRPTAN